MEFHNTGYAKDFFGHQLPSLIKNIGKLAEEKKRANDLKEKEIEGINLNKKLEGYE